MGPGVKETCTYARARGQYDTHERKELEGSAMQDLKSKSSFLMRQPPVNFMRMHFSIREDATGRKALDACGNTARIVYTELIGSLVNEYICARARGRPTLRGRSRAIGGGRLYLTYGLMNSYARLLVVCDRLFVDDGGELYSHHYLLRASRHSFLYTVLFYAL